MSASFMYRRPVASAAVGLLVFAAVSSRGHAKSQRYAKQEAFHKFIKKVEEKKGQLSDNDRSLIERHFIHDDIERAFTKDEVNPDQPIFVVRALNLLAGPSPSVREIFFANEKADVPSAKRITDPSTETNIVQESAPNTDTAPTPPSLEITHNFTEKQLHQLTPRELVSRAIDLAESHGYLSKKASTWRNFIDSLYAHDVAPYFDPLKYAFHIIAHEQEISAEAYVRRIRGLIESRDLTAVAKLIGQLSAIVARAEWTLPPRTKEDGKPWSLGKYGILSPARLLQLRKSSSDRFASDAIFEPLLGDAWSDFHDYREIDLRLGNDSRTNGGLTSSGDHIRLVYGNIPPRGMLLDTAAATLQTKPNGVNLSNDTLAVRILDTARQSLTQYKPTTQRGFSDLLLRAIEGDMLGVEFYGNDSAPWFHLELLSRTLELWTHLRNGNPNAAGTAISDLAAYLKTNPVTSTMLNLGVEAKMVKWDDHERIALHPWEKKREGIWLWSNKDPLRFVRLLPASTAPTRPLEPVMDDDKVRYLFLSPGLYMNSDTQKTVTIELAAR